MFPSLWEGSSQVMRDCLEFYICPYIWNDAHFFINAASFCLRAMGAL